MKYMYEVADTTDEDIFFPLGVFESLHDAVTAIKEIEAEGKAISDNDSWETIVVYQRTVGWSGIGTPIITIEREEYFDESLGEYRWRIIEGCAGASMLPYLSSEDTASFGQGGCNCDEHVRLVAEAVLAERERCARIAEGVHRTEDRRWVPGSLYDTLRRETAADIRWCDANGGSTTRL